MIEEKIVVTLASAIRAILLLCGCFAIFTLIIYAAASGWNNAAVWGAFGDFVGGLLNPVFAFANLVVLVVISYQLKAMDEKRADRELRVQKQIGLYNLKHDSFQRLSTLLDQVPLAVAEDVSSAALKLRVVNFELAGFLATNLYLFPVLQTYNSQPLYASIHDIIKAAEPFSKDLDPAIKESRARLYQNLTDSVAVFARLRTELTLLMGGSFYMEHYPEASIN